MKAYQYCSSSPLTWFDSKIFTLSMTFPAPFHSHYDMSTKGHKRKRSIQDTSVDLNKMKMAMNHLISLKEELDGIQETEGEMEVVIEHVHALQKILESAKKPNKPHPILPKHLLIRDNKLISIIRAELVWLLDNTILAKW